MREKEINVDDKPGDFGFQNLKKQQGMWSIVWASGFESISLWPVALSRSEHAMKY